MTPMETILSIMICTIVAFQAGREFGEWRYRNAKRFRKQKES